MIKTIKVKKKLRLDELIKHIFDNDIRGGHFFCCTEDTHIKVFDDGRVYSNYAFSKSDIFTVEVEEEITEDTEFEALVFILVSGRIEVINNYHNIRSARSLIENYETEKQIYALVNGKLQLIWEAENSERN